MNIYRLIISGILTLSFVLPLVASAQTITLRAIGGRITITGELLEFDGLRYLVETRVGDVSFRVDEVECIAGDCPEIPETVAETEPEVDTSPAPVSEPEPDSTPIVNSNTSLPTITVDEVLNVEQPVAQPIESSVTIAPSAPEAPSPSIQPAVPTLDTQPTSAESPSSPTIETEAATNATSSPAEGIGGEFNMAGSQTIAEALMPQLIEAYGLENDLSMIKSVVGSASNTFRYELEDSAGVIIQTVNITANSTDEGLLSLVEQTADLTLASRRVRPDEDQLLASAGVGRIMGTESERVIALDGIVVIVARNNRLDALSEQEMAAIFSGQITNWSELGESNLPITVYRRENGSAAAEIFSKLVLDEFGVRMRPDAVIVTSDAELSDKVARDPGGIGFTSFANIRNASSLAVRGSCGIQSIPTEFTIKSEDYPLTRRLYVYKSGNRLNLSAEAFIAYLESERAQHIISNSGFVSMLSTEESLSNQGMRFASILADPEVEADTDAIRALSEKLTGASRLSTTFRFEAGGTEMDERSTGAIARISRQIDSGRFDDMTLLLAGVTDATGRATANESIGLQRARNVREAILRSITPAAARQVTLEIEGFGEISPLVCNGAPRSDYLNRRVEVWLLDN